MDKTSNKSPVSLEEIEGIDDLAGARKLSKKFNPPVSLRKCDLGMQKERLRLAVSKAEGKMKDIDELGNVMTTKKKEDDKNRLALLGYFTQLKIILYQMEDKMQKHVDNEYATRHLEEQIQKFSKQLAYPPTKMVVAGETSSGKSTLLNIFISENKDEQTPFLKSGITLIDTPGIGESEEMGNVLKNFVKHNDIFGFVFTLCSCRAGGILQEFQNILRDLSTDEYVDSDNQKKFNPTCCMFVANFWDQVPDCDKETQKKNIFDTLNSLPFMHNFCPEEQVFFLDAVFAYHTKHEGMITEDLSRFIDGLSELVWKEQRRKLKMAYGWLENSLQRLLHPVRSYVRRLKQTGTVRRKNKDKTVKYLGDIETKFKEIMEENRKLFHEKVSAVSKMLLTYMEGPEAIQKVTEWTSKDIPKEEPGNDWVLTEIGLDEAIDERVSDIFQDWEKNKKLLSRTEQEMYINFTLHFDAIGNELEAVERDIRSTNQHIELATEQSDIEDQTPTFEFPELLESAEARQFSINFGCTHGSDLMISKPKMDLIMDNMSSGPSLKIQHTKAQNTSLPLQQDIQKYIKDKVAYMSERSKYIFNKMSTIEFASLVVTQQFKPLLEYLDNTEQVTCEVIQSNKKLLIGIAEDKRTKGDVEKLYAPIEEELVNLLDNVLMFGKSHVVKPDFGDSDVISVEKFVSKSLFCSLGYGRLAESQLPQNSFRPPVFDVTFKKTRGMATPSLKPSDRFFQEKNLRQFARREDVVKFWGTYQYNGERLLVLDGTLLTARKYLLQGRLWDAKAARKRTMLDHFQFLLQLGQALTFLHLKELVHVELSLDSILVKNPQGGGGGLPLLSNLSEPTKVPLCANPNVPLNQYIHLPPEVLKQKSLYTQEADIYGLGIIMLELWNQTDVFADIKKTVHLGKWISKDDQGSVLIEEARSYQKKFQPGEKMSQAWKEVVSNCLARNPLKRLTAKLWQDEFIALMDTTFS